jgi:hypothetical protein
MGGKKGGSRKEFQLNTIVSNGLLLITSWRVQ